MKDKAIRTIGQFQLMKDTSLEQNNYYVQNTILESKLKGSGKSYNFGENRKQTLMLVSDEEFVSRAKQSAGNNI